ncbi:hypothetical protein [Salinimicrobium sp. TH3]|uniref:hypothetical protein n=1 Tax=Salinimicrobium sp. TH3 TaxID=2997342 RepID=UPI002275748B|nr:hypothetical protein [Salinimicrobium sp. TH3]MCY2688453.1 hypothetical protein [Salinimicrobium sp. TH3]
MKNLKLIDGTFSPAEARDILLNMIGSKIHFHNKRDFSSKIRIGSSDRSSRVRLDELRETREHIISFLEKAEREGSTVSIKSSIILSCSTEEQAEKL